MYITAPDDGLHKIVELEPYFPTGELSVQPVVLWANGRPCYESLTKHASVASEYFKTITPTPGHSIVYVLALGAWETYGENRNGDGFPEFPFMETADPPWIEAKDSLVQHYLSFEKFGHNYRHHVNKDPQKAVGSVVKAFWNPSMHRVELLVDLDNAKAPDLADRIAAGEFPPVSMGTRVKYDVCSFCGNRAPTRAHYCDHLKFNMRGVINGKKIAALNPSPKFFDISWVFRPADATAFMMKKVAEPATYELISGAAAGEYIDAMNLQKAAAHKLAVINKVVQGIPVDAKTEGVDEAQLACIKQMRPLALEAGRNTPDLPDNLLKSLAQQPLPKVFSSLMASGMIQLSTPEVTKLIMYKSYPNKKVPDSILNKAVGAQQGVLNLFEEFPQILEQLKKTGALNICAENVDADIVAAASPYVEKRAGVGQYLKRRFVPEKWREETPYSTPLSITDPGSGQRYGTTRGAAIRAHDEIAKRNLYKMLGGGLLLGGAYKLMGHGLDRKGMGALKPVAALGLGALGVTQLPSMGKHYMTDQGVPVPTMTEMAKVSASASTSLALPVLGTLGTMAALSHDYQSRLKSGIPIGYEHLPLSRRVLDSVEQFAQDHPIITAAGGTVAGHKMGRLPLVRRMASTAKNLGRPVVETLKGGMRGAKETLHGLAQGVKLSSVTDEMTIPQQSAVILPDVNLDKLAEWLGWAVLEG